MKSVLNALAWLAMCLALSGCAAAQFNRAAVTQVREGMSEADVESLAGKPSLKIPRHGCPNVTTWIWSSGRNVGQVIFRNGVVFMPPTTTETSDDEWVRQQTENEARLAGLLADLRRQEYLKSRPNISPAVRDAVAKGRLTVGMSEDDVRASWGDPDRVNRSGGVGATSAQMVYGNGSTITYYVYLTGGVLTRWQTLGEK